MDRKTENQAENSGNRDMKSLGLKMEYEMDRINSILFYSEKSGAEDGVRNGQNKFYSILF